MSSIFSTIFTPANLRFMMVGLGNTIMISIVTIALSMFFGTILAGSAVFVLLEEPVKSGDTGKSCLDSNLGNGEVRVGQKFFSGFDASVT